MRARANALSSSGPAAHRGSWRLAPAAARHACQRPARQINCRRPARQRPTTLRLCGSGAAQIGCAAPNLHLVGDSRGGCSPAARHGLGIRHELSRATRRADELAAADTANRARLGRRRELGERRRPKELPRRAAFGHEPETAIDHGALGGRERIRCAVGRLCDAPRRGKSPL